MQDSLQQLIRCLEKIKSTSEHKELDGYIAVFKEIIKNTPAQNIDDNLTASCFVTLITMEASKLLTDPKSVAHLKNFCNHREFKPTNLSLPKPVFEIFYGISIPDEELNEEPSRKPSSSQK